MTLSQKSLDLIIKTLAKRLFEDEKVIIRLKAAESLGKLGNEKAILSLCQALDTETETEVIIAIMDAIVEIKQSIKINPSQPQNKFIFEKEVYTSAINIEKSQYNNPNSSEQT